MTTATRLFASAMLSTMRMLEENGQVLFCAKDVAKALGAADTAKAMTKHSEKDGWAIRPVIDRMGYIQNLSPRKQRSR